ncbi:MAG: S8 family serine peptidase [Bryobacteraceae bacterium]|nr:S8 family serine peptidase [Bryobacteraceae bacterium]
MKRNLMACFILALLVLAAVSPSMAQRVRGEYALVLEDPPLVQQISAREGFESAAAEEARERIQEAQDKLVAELEQRGIAVVSRSHTLVNAVFVRAPQSRLEELRGLPGVRRVSFLPPVKRHLNRAAGLVKAPEAWTALGGMANAGAGIKIGIIDSGIDVSHPAFQDPSLTPPPGFPKCSPAGGGWNCSDYTNKKVIVARSYVHILARGSSSSEPWLDSRPDDLSPRDRVGHGTANAMIAAGVTNTSPEGITITGVAPKAFLGNYKIFGSPGVNDYTFGSAIIAALEDAFLDGMDIVTLSLGSPAVYGPLDRGAACGLSNPNAVCDIRADAVQNAVSNGLVVVVSAGNEGDLGVYYPMYNIISTPGTAPGAITVGATTSSHVFFQSVRILGTGVPANLQRINALLGDGPKPSGAMTAPLRDITTVDSTGLACASLPTNSLAGAIALIKRGSCTFFTKVSNAQEAGAVGVIFYLDDPADALFSPAGLIGTTIPAAMIDNASGTALRSFLAANPGRQAVIDPSLNEVDAAFDEIAAFSSRGPAIGTFDIKPELVAVGTDMFTATQKYDPNSDMYDPSGYSAYSGTSFSAPLVAGAAALVKQKTPNLKPADVKSALVNTASSGIQDPGAGDADVLTAGAGKLNVDAALRANVSVDPAALSFGDVSAWPPTPRTLWLRNLGSSPVTVTLNAPAPLSLSQTSVVLQPGAAATPISVNLSGSVPQPGSYQTFVTISGGAVPLRVPVFFVRPDGVPDNMIALYGDGFIDLPGGDIDFPNQLIVKVVDRYGAPVPNLPVLFRPAQGYGGRVIAADARTDTYGIAAADVLPGNNIGEQVFEAVAGGMVVQFFGTTIAPPFINTRGVVSAANGLENQGQAPGSYISIYGTGLSPASKALSTPYVPLSLAGVSVSFDTLTLSVPGRVHYVSPYQLNVLVPWELAGLNSVRTKVSIGDFSTAVYTLTLRDYAPVLFQYPLSSGFAVALWNNTVVTPSNPVPRGQKVTLFVNGMGPVDNPVPTGEMTPLLPLSRTTTTPTVTIGGVPAQVSFSGLAPLATGIYMLDVTVPAGAPTGNQPVVVTIGDVSSPAVNLPIS